MTVVQRTCSDLRVNPHLHAVFLDGTWHEEEGGLVFRGLGHLRTSEVGEVLERTIVRIERFLGRRDRVRGREEEAEGDGEVELEVSAVSGRTPPAGPQWTVRLRPPEAAGMAYEKPLCVSEDGFTLHAATRAGGLDTAGREALLRYVLRPPIAQDKVEARPDGLVRITLNPPIGSRGGQGGPTPTGPSPWTPPTGGDGGKWTRSLCCAGWRRASPRPATTRCAMRGCWGRRAGGGRGSCRRRRQKIPGPRRPGRRRRGAGTGDGRSFPAARSAWTPWPARPAGAG